MSDKKNDIKEELPAHNGVDKFEKSYRPILDRVDRNKPPQSESNDNNSGSKKDD